MKRHYGLILILLLLGFGLRVWNLAVQSFWWDEAFIYQATSRGWANLVAVLQTSDRHPPLYHASIAVWSNLAGWSEFSLRFVSVFWGVVGLAFVFKLGKRVYNTSAGGWALAVAAVAPMLVVYAQEARMYSMFFALTTAALYFGFAWLDFGFDPQAPAARRRRFMMALLFSEAGLLLTHYFAVPFVLALNLLALGILYRRRAARSIYLKWIGLQVVAAAPLIVWSLIILLTPSSMTQAAEVAPDLITFVRQGLTLWFSGVRDLKSEWGGLILIALLLTPFVIGGAWRVNVRHTRWLLALTMLSVGLAYVLTLALTAFHPRYLLPYSAPLFVLLGAALSNLSAAGLAEGKRSSRRRRLIGAVTASLMLLALVMGWQAATAPAFAKDDARGVAAYLKQNASAKDVILVEDRDYTLNYYDHGPASTRMITATTEAEAFKQLSEAIGNAPRVWLPHWNVSTQDSRGYWPFLLEQSGRLVDWKSFQGYEVQGYEMQAPLHEPSLTERIDSAAHVSRRISLVDAVHPDGALAVAIEWQLPMKQRDSSKVSLRLLDATGQQISSVDRPLLNELGQTTERWSTSQPVTNYYILPIPLFSPPGTYTVTGTLYKGRDVLAEDFLGTLQASRYLYSSLDDPHRSLAGYKWETPHVEDGSKLMLEKFAVGTSRPQPLAQMDIALLWFKPYTFDSTTYITPQLRLVQNGRVWSKVDSALLTQRYPVSQWAAGEAVLDRVKIDYPPVRGPIDLQIGQGAQWITLTTLQLDESALKFDVPSLQHAQSAQFGDFAELLGYDLKSDSLSPDRSLPLTLYWRATNTEPIATSYTVFTQILAPDGHLVAQHDAPPAPPTRQWVPGQIVIDPHAIKLVDPAYRGPATLIVGWYNSASVQRVPVENGGDYVTLQVPVRVEDQ